MRKLLLLAFCFSLSIGFSTEYKGNVGKMAAVFDLEWRGDGTVQGSYHYPDRAGVVYRLIGTNPEEGKIALEEYTGNDLSARCVLTKSVTNREIIWVGTMYNLDGREFEMIFARPLTGSTPPPPEPERPDFAIDRTLDAENVIPLLGKPGNLEAHLYGSLYYGWTLPEETSDDDSILSRLNDFRNAGTLVWAAMRFQGEQVELQFEATDGRRHILKGGNPTEGQIVLRDESEKLWTLKKHLVGESIVWIGGSASAPDQSLLIYRPINKFYHGSFESMKRLAPEAFLWEFNEWGHQFHRERFAYTYEDEIPAVVKTVHDSKGLVSSVVLQLEDGRSETIAIDPPRPRNRVPVAPDFPVSVSYRNGKIEYLLVELNPIAWRQRGEHTLELKLFAPALADITWNDLGDPVIPPGKLETLEKISLVPDYAILADFVYASWFIPEDKITWGIGDRGAGMLELESLSLGGDSTPSPTTTERIGPWQPIATPVDFVTNQIRIVHMSTTTMFGKYLPEEE